LSLRLGGAGFGKCGIDFSIQKPIVQNGEWVNFRNNFTNGSSLFSMAAWMIDLAKGLLNVVGPMHWVAM